MDFYKIDQSIPRELPLLNKWIDAQPEKDVLKGVAVLCIQHQLGNHYPQTQALTRLGLDPNQLIWIDVPYTATPEVRQAMIEELKIPEDNFHIHSFKVLDRYPPYQIDRVQRIFADLLSDPPRRLVVLDDGAYFIEAASCFAKQLPAVAIVEQTTRGLIKIEENAALNEYLCRIPLINVARSAPKKTLEPPFIGRAVCDSLFHHIGPYISKYQKLRCLVLGFGAIGQQVAEFLPRKIGFDRSRVHVCDPDDKREKAALEAGFSLWDRNNFRDLFHLVIGCSGHRSFTFGDRVYLENGAILASASSGTVELSRQDFIEIAAISEIDDISVSKDGLDECNVHSDLHIHLVDRSVTFVNGGFPVNFDGRVNCIPGRYIQPTPTMMVAATVQAVKAIDNQQKGKIELDAAFCNWIDDAFRKELQDESSLIPPAR